jgi:hypothetical protein
MLACVGLEFVTIRRFMENVLSTVAALFLVPFCAGGGVACVACCRRRILLVCRLAIVHADKGIHLLHHCVHHFLVYCRH